MQVLWSPQSLRDIRAIRDYIAKDSEQYAEVTVARIFSAVERLLQFPESGRIVPEKGIRRFGKSSLDGFGLCTGFAVR